MPDSRKIIRERAAQRGLSFSALSIMAGRDVACVQQFIERGSPRKLPEDVGGHVKGTSAQWNIRSQSIGHLRPKADGQRVA